MATSGFGALFGRGGMSDLSPHGEERVFPAVLALSGARLRTMLRIAGKIMGLGSKFVSVNSP